MDTLTREVAIVAMSKALDDCPDLSIRDSRRWHYMRAEIPEGHIRAFDSAAVFNQEQRRKLYPAKQPGIPGILARLADEALYFLASAVVIIGLVSLPCRLPARGPMGRNGRRHSASRTRHADALSHGGA